jgi:hypothetical protein
MMLRFPNYSEKNNDDRLSRLDTRKLTVQLWSWQNGSGVLHSDMANLCNSKIIDTSHREAMEVAHSGYVEKVMELEAQHKEAAVAIERPTLSFDACYNTIMEVTLRSAQDAAHMGYYHEVERLQEQNRAAANYLSVPPDDFSGFLRDANWCVVM